MNCLCFIAVIALLGQDQPEEQQGYGSKDVVPLAKQDNLHEQPVSKGMLLLFGVRDLTRCVLFSCSIFGMCYSSILNLIGEA